MDDVWEELEPHLDMLRVHRDGDSVYWLRNLNAVAIVMHICRRQ